MKISKNNIFEDIPTIIPEELLENLLIRENMKIERIISYGHSTAVDDWYDQAWDEWVLLLSGEAIVGFEMETRHKLEVGDYLFIPAHTRHRVEWTPPDTATIWLAIHFYPSKQGDSQPFGS